ncbi:MAG: hypothetical protein MUF61_00475 [archaeon]|jgi:hypothetical protein|nr:hypothetical protein [archaeon]
MHTKIKKLAGPVKTHPAQAMGEYHSKMELVEKLTLASIEYTYRVLHHENPDSEKIREAKRIFQEGDRIFRQRYHESFLAYECRTARGARQRQTRS